MFSFLNTGKKDGTKVVPEKLFADLLIEENGTVVDANQAFVELAQTITQKRFSRASILGKTVSELFGKQYKDTIIGTFLRNKERINGMFLIIDQLYQVIVEEVVDDRNIYYEIVYFPIHSKEACSEEKVFQLTAYKTAKQKGFTNVEWIRSLSDGHGRQLVQCLSNHEHSTKPDIYCPYQKECGFHPVHGWMQLDRRAFFRSQVELLGELHLLSLKDRPVPGALSRKMVSCKALNLSMGGMLLQLDNVCLPDECVVKITFEHLTCEGTVKWTASQGGKWLTGIKFLTLSPEQQHSFIKLITKKTGSV